MNKRTIFGAALALCASVSLSHAQIITNGSFEDFFNGWSVTGNVDVVQYNTSDGIKSARFNSAESTPNAVLAQSFPTAPGERYALQFDFGVWGGGAGAEQRVSVQVSGSTVTLSNVVTEVGTGLPVPMTLVTHRIYFWADATNSTVTFRDVSLETWSTDGHLDNVTVEWVAPVLSIRVSQVELCWGSQSNQLYQVQYCSTLTTNRWTDLGSPIPGSSPITCTYDAVEPGMPQRFYQVLRLGPAR